MMRVLLVNPHFPDSYWSGRHALAFAGRQSLLPPLPLLTVAALLPQDWDMRLIDMDVQPLSDEDLLAADVVMLTGMLVQRQSMHEVLARCRKLGLRTVVGGPYATALPDEVAALADHLVIGEGEYTIPQLAADLLNGTARSRYNEPLDENPAIPPEQWKAKKPDMTLSPTPRYDLLDIRHYHQMGLQSSRGCPFNCEFCDIIVMFGRVPRVKSAGQIIRELDAIKATGFQGSVFWVDDNFIGNKKEIRKLLPVIAAWRKNYGTMLDFYTEASMNLADDRELVRSMTDAGFAAVFIGIETPSEEGLKETHKLQNTKRDLKRQVRDLQEWGLDVWAGFILGFDSDKPEIFDQMIDFIDEAAIPYAMVGMLGALPNTPLFEKMVKTGRIRELHTGDQFGLTNFETKLPASQMIAGYHKVIASLYSGRKFFSRCRKNLARWKPAGVRRSTNWAELRSGMRAFYTQAVKSPYRLQYWLHLMLVMLRHPTKLRRAIAQAAAGHHYITFTRETVIPRLKQQAAMLEPMHAAMLKHVTDST
ncbi:MAG: B12-binding domain-containing radical SAM protein [Candidatus Komeilibacteria bacterium]|nr:B12-binding domain-containing radical SAM protein [Candidatus Komeilibacteria bacterium]